MSNLLFVESVKLIGDTNLVPIVNQIHKKAIKYFILVCPVFILFAEKKIKTNDDFDPKMQSLLSYGLLKSSKAEQSIGESSIYYRFFNKQTIKAHE